MYAVYYVTASMIVYPCYTFAIPLPLAFSLIVHWGPHEIIVRPKGDKNFVSEWEERRHWALSNRQRVLCASIAELECKDTLNIYPFANVFRIFLFFILASIL